MGLSRRVPFFVGDEVAYRCRKAEHLERFADVFGKGGGTVGATLGSLLPEAILMEDAFFDYSVMLLHYTRRAVTDQHDAFRHGRDHSTIRRSHEVSTCSSSSVPMADHSIADPTFQAIRGPAGVELLPWTFPPEFIPLVLTTITTAGSRTGHGSFGTKGVPRAWSTSYGTPRRASPSIRWI